MVQFVNFETSTDDFRNKSSVVDTSSALNQWHENTDPVLIVIATMQNLLQFLHSQQSL